MKAQGSGLQHPPRIHDVLIDQQLGVGAVHGVDVVAVVVVAHHGVGVGGQGQLGLPSQNNCLDLRIQAGQFAVNGLQNVPQVVGQPRSLVHTGTASANTRPRNLSGRALGVSTSTDTPNSFSSST